MSAICSNSSRRIPVSTLTPTSFCLFGEVVQNPRTHSNEPALQTLEANQGTATKWLDVSHMPNFYYSGGCEAPARCVMNMFVCRPRGLKHGRFFKVGMLERHPWTPQTFVPMGLAKEDRETAYLVVVAPTLPTGAKESRARRRQVLGTQDDYGKDARQSEQRHKREFQRAQEERQKIVPTDEEQQQQPRGQGDPDLSNIKAFIARGDQAVTYGAGTWHAPMVVLGEREIEFLVVQYANGVPDEDCQETDMIDRGQGGETIEVDVGSGIEDTAAAKTKL